MMRVTVLPLTLTLCWLLQMLPTWGQGVDFFSTEPETFISEFHNVLSQSRNEQAQENGEVLLNLWNTGTMSDAEKETFIILTNELVGLRLSTHPQLSQFTGTYARLKQGNNPVKIPADRFLAVTAQCASKLSQEDMTKYLKALYNYTAEGYATQLTRFYWYISSSTPELRFTKIKTAQGEREVPIIHYAETDLKYYSSRSDDSTLISGAKGDFFLLSKTFKGENGRITWAKVGLDPDDVYCELGKYKLNFNYGLVKVDTVTFYYKSLIDQPLKGRFEDRNIGHQNPEKANYPFFQSYGGGVVIDKLITNFRYEGGFSLRGQRKVGTGYDEWVEPKEVEGTDFASSTTSSTTSGGGAFEDDWSGVDWSETEWGDYEEEASTFTESDSEFDSWGADSDDGSTEGGFGGFGDESALYGMMQVHRPARMELRRGDKTLLKLTGDMFLLEPEEMVGKNLEAAIYTTSSDSIYHPDMNMRYEAADSLVMLEKPRRGTFRNVPFISSYHDYYLNFETIIWDLAREQLSFTALIDQENKVSAIESFDYFTRSRMNRYKGVLKFNPIGAIYRFQLKYPDEPILPESVLKEYDLYNDHEMRAFELALPDLEGAGFITFDRVTKEIFPLPKLITWAQAARKVKDYDAIQILSQVDTGSHAVMNPSTMDIELRGVRGFSLSDSVFLRVVPSNDRVIVQKNRNLRFGGTMAAGRINLYSSNLERPSFTFNYGSYMILCDSIDSLRFNLVRNRPSDYKPTPLELALSSTVFNKVTGAIHIDDPDNKSGEKGGRNSRSASEEAYYAQYPVFDSYSRSYLYWDKPSIQGGVYVQDSFYFAVDPFVLDSLESFKEGGLKFGGELYSSNIFPPIQQDLAVMGDNTLGFMAVSPPNGYNIYGRNGRFFDTLSLDSYGLHGNGTVEYLGTVAKSDTFTFHFDSVMARVSYFNLKRGYNKGVYFPEVNAQNALYTWYTKDSALKIRSDYEALSVFGGEGLFEGTLSITQRGMTGDGVLLMGGVKVDGDEIIFNEYDFLAEEADFILVDGNEENPAHFVAHKARIQYDVRRHTSTFESNDASAESSEFPLHQYATSLVRGTYNRRDSILKLETDSLSSPQYFVSTDPKQDSLRFNAKDAVYDLRERAIRVAGVDSILVADAIVRPDGQKVAILEDGLIQPLTNAVVEADQRTKMHRIYEAEIQIRSRHEYEGSGKYDYIEVNGKEQFINFANIRVSSDEHTIASGEIREDVAFYLTERIFFKGQAELDARDRFLSFEGDVKIESENPVFKGAWFPFEKTVVDPDSVFIPISNETLVNDLGENLTVGLVYQPEDRYFYSRFLQVKEDEFDPTVIEAQGGLTFDRKKKEFRIGSKDKLKGRVYKGSTVAFNDSVNTITSAGLLRFPTEFEEKTVSIKASGSWQENIDRNTINTDLLMGFDFQDVIPDDAMEELVKLLQPLIIGNPDIAFQEPAFQEAAAELLDEGEKGERKTQEFVKQVETAMATPTSIKLAGELGFTLLLSNVDFRYDPDYKALYCDANVGLVGLGGEPLNKMVNSKIVYQYGTISADGEKQKDKFTIVLELDRNANNVLYFHFEDETLSTYFSSISYPEIYNGPIQQAIEKRKSDEGFHVELANEEDIAEFTRNFVLRFIR